MNRKYVIISPVRDEIEFAQRTLDSVTGQSVPPALWIIVDDGSTDGTSELLATYAARFPYIRIHRRQNRGLRSVGPGVIEAFYDGLGLVENLQEFEYLCKLDLDLDLPRQYFELLIQRMEAEPRLGTCSGKAYFPAPTNTLSWRLTTAGRCRRRKITLRRIGQTDAARRTHSPGGSHRTFGRERPLRPHRRAVRDAQAADPFAGLDDQGQQQREPDAGQPLQTGERGGEQPGL
jgi:hypothetical protein